MASRVFTNPFAIPPKGNSSNKPKPSGNATSFNSHSAIHQKAAESLQSFINYNPTLTETQANDTRSAPCITYNGYINSNNKRTFHAMNSTNYQHSPIANKRRKRQKYPNDGGLTDTQYETIMEARRNETEQDISRYIEQRKRNYPIHENVERKRSIIEVKTKRGQLLSVNERIMKHQDDTGNKKTPSVLRFLKTPKFDENIVRKVLKKEIEQEYSAILQCFRYIIKTNYLSTDPNDDANDDEEIEVNECKDTGNSVENVRAFDIKDIEQDEIMMEKEEEDVNDELDIDLDEINPCTTA